MLMKYTQPIQLAQKRNKPTKRMQLRL